MTNYVIRIERDKKDEVMKALSKLANIDIDSEGNPVTIWFKADAPVSEIEKLPHLIDFIVNDNL